MKRLAAVCPLLFATLSACAAPKSAGAYSVTPVPTAVCPTGTAANGPVKVVGEPRVTKGHPCTTWDRVDIERMRKLLKTSSEFRRQADGLKAAMDRRITLPVAVPQPRKGPDGKWMHISDREVGKTHNNLGLDIANLGTAYQLFQDDKYADYCLKLLLAYADAYPNYGIGARPGFSHDPSKVFDQRLSDGTWLIQVAIGYDFIHDYRGITPEMRAHIEKDFIADNGRHIQKNHHTINSPTNWSAIDVAAVLIAGYACDDQWLIDRAMFGWNTQENGGTPQKWWEGKPNPKPSGVELHFSPQCIDVDGMWAEGAMGYQFMALQALVLDAEILWHHGIDLYRYRDCAMKAIFDSPLLFVYPTLCAPAIHDSGNASIVGYDSYLYEYGYLRYRDPAYLQVLRQIKRRLGASFQQFTVSTLWDEDLAKDADKVVPRNVNLNGVGYGILRQTDREGTRSILLDYGPNRSHGHPDKLNLDVWGFGELLIPDPGCVWYEQPIYRSWYRTTFAHNTIAVDMQEQKACGAELLVYAPGTAVGVQRARTDGAAEGVTLDRSVFMTTEYFADIFGAFSKSEHTYDLTWHPMGEVKVPDGTAPFSFGSAPPGYSQVRNAVSLVTDRDAVTPFEIGGRSYSLLAVGGTETTHVWGKAAIQSGKPAQTPLCQRRKADNTVFANVVDWSNAGAVKSAVATGGVKDGCLSLAVTLKDGGRDWLFASARDGSHMVAKTVTDAQCAFVRLDARGTLKAMVLGGGKKLSVGGKMAIESVKPGSFVVERVGAKYFVTNASSADASVRVVLPSGSRSFKLKPAETVDFSGSRRKKGQG